MKIKLLAVSVFVLALGINTAKAQNRRGTRDHGRYENRGREHGDLSVRGNRHHDRSFNHRGDGRSYRSDRMMRNRHRSEFGRHGRSERRSYFHKRHHNRRHSF